MAVEAQWYTNCERNPRMHCTVKPGLAELLQFSGKDVEQPEIGILCDPGDNGVVGTPSLVIPTPHGPVPIIQNPHPIPKNGVVIERISADSVLVVSHHPTPRGY